MISPDRQALNVFSHLSTLYNPFALLGWAVTTSSLLLGGGGLASLAAVAWWQARQWRLRHSLLSSDYLTIAAERSQAEQARAQTEVFYHSLVETIPQMILC